MEFAIGMKHGGLELEAYRSWLHFTKPSVVVVAAKKWAFDAASGFDKTTWHFDIPGLGHPIELTTDEYWVSNVFERMGTYREIEVFIFKGPRVGATDIELEIGLPGKMLARPSITMNCPGSIPSLIRHEIDNVGGAIERSVPTAHVEHSIGGPKHRNEALFNLAIHEEKLETHCSSSSTPILNPSLNRAKLSFEPFEALVE